MADPEEVQPGSPKHTLVRVENREEPMTTGLCSGTDPCCGHPGRPRSPRAQAPPAAAPSMLGVERGCEGASF